MDATTGVQPHGRGYEFGAGENAVIGDTARWVGIWAWFAIVGGVLTGVVGIFAMPVGLVNLAIAALYVVIGMWFRGAAQSLSSVVTTEGSDVEHLMGALVNLKSAFKAMAIATVMGIALIIVFGLVAAAAAVALTNSVGG